MYSAQFLQLSAGEKQKENSKLRGVKIRIEDDVTLGSLKKANGHK